MQVRKQNFFRAIGGGRCGWRFMEIGRFDKDSSKTPEKEAPRGNIFELLVLDTLKTFWMETLTERQTQSGPFFQKIRALFQIFKTGWGDFSSRPYLRASISSSILNIFENVWINCFDYARALNMHDHATYLTGFWRCLGF